MVGPLRLPTSNFQSGRSGHTPRAIVVHTTDGTFSGTLAWFASPESRVSAHYLVGLDGRVVDLVDEGDTAFHAGSVPHPELAALGDEQPNLVTIGIEFDDGGRPHDVDRPDAQYRAGAALLAGIAGRWAIPLDREHVLAHNLLNREKTCPGNLDIDRLVSMAATIAPTGARGADASPRLVVLLPARNAAADLPDWFSSVERFADAIVALDDGSTDGTAAMLEAHPLVEVVLRNPRRETYEGWDDSANRNRLLAAASDVEADWILSLDADERIPEGDAEALRRFVETDALPGLAYGMRCYRMVDDLEHYDRNALWVYRLFAFAPGQTFPSSRLHFVPIPTSIPRDRWVRTTVRIQHVASLTADRRAARRAKYREADPEVEYQAGYDHLLDEPADVAEFAPRRRDLPVLAVASEADLDAPVLSAVVISRDDEERIERTVRSVVNQRCSEPFEVIVVTSGTDRTAAIVRERFPEVRLVELDYPALPGEARNAGLRFARGDYVSFPGSHVELPPGSLAARIAAHDEGWTMVTGTTRNGTNTAAGWAAYFLDHSSVLPDRPSQQLGAAPAHCSYEAGPLLATGGFPDDIRAGEDTRGQRRALPLGCHRVSGGGRTTRAPQPVPFGGGARPTSLRARAGSGAVPAGPALPCRRDAARPASSCGRTPRVGWRAIDRNVQTWGGDLRPRYRRVRPLVRLGVLAAWLGGYAELLRPSLPPGSSERRSMAPDGLRAEPAVTSPLTRPLRVRRPTSAPARHAGAHAVFLHIPKTAGSTMYRILEREYAGLPTFRLYGDIDERIRALEALTEQERAELRLVCGHMGFGVHRLLPGRSAYVTLLRDPVDRIVSHYHYTRSRPTQQGHARAMEGVTSIDDYVRVSAFAPIFNNGQTRLLGSDLKEAGEPADEGTLERALAVIDRDDVVIGLQDRFDESLLVMMRAFGWGYPAYRRENVGHHRPDVEALRPPPSTSSASAMPSISGSTNTPATGSTGILRRSRTSPASWSSCASPPAGDRRSSARARRTGTRPGGHPPRSSAPRRSWSAARVPRRAGARSPLRGGCRARVSRPDRRRCSPNRASRGSRSPWCTPVLREGMRSVGRRSCGRSAAPTSPAGR